MLAGIESVIASGSLLAFVLVGAASAGTGPDRPVAARRRSDEDTHIRTRMHEVQGDGEDSPRCAGGDRRRGGGGEGGGDVEKVEDIQAMVSAGILTTPAVEIDGEVKVAGRVPKPDEIRKLVAG